MKDETFFDLFEIALRKGYFQAAIALIRYDSRAKEWNRRLDVLP